MENVVRFIRLDLFLASVGLIIRRDIYIFREYKFSFPENEYIYFVFNLSSHILNSKYRITWFVYTIKWFQKYVYCTTV